MEYIGSKGNTYYLVDNITKEGYSFSMFGSSIEPIDANYVFVICKNLRPVNIFSIVNDPTTKISEVYYMGKRSLIKANGMDIIRSIPKEFQMETVSAFRILREDCPGLVQLVIPFTYGKVSIEMLSKVLGNISWV